MCTTLGLDTALGKGAVKFGLDNIGFAIEFALWDVISQRSITEGAGQPIRQACGATIK